jgi:hypothetical protein
MAFFAILEPLIALLVLAGLITQCLIPELMGQPWFPIFRRAWKLRGDVAKVNEEIVAEKVERRLTELKGDKDDATTGIDAKGGPGRSDSGS